MKYREATVQELSDIIGIPFIGENITINGLNLCNRRSVYHSIVSYLSDPAYTKYLKDNNFVKVLFVNEEIYEAVSKQYRNITYFLDEYPEFSFYTLHERLLKSNVFYKINAADPIIGKNCNIHKTVVLEDNIVIGDNAIIEPYSVIKKGTIIGDNVRIGCGSIIGAEGFQVLKNPDGKYYLVKHIGRCKIGDDVFIGNNVTICKSIFEDYTYLGNNAKIGDLVYIAHNCEIGSNCVLAPGVILAGSVCIENNVWLAPGVTVLNRKAIKKDSFVGIGSVVTSNVNEGTRVAGYPAKRLPHLPGS